MRVPAYRRSARPYRRLEELTYPFHDRTFTVTQRGRICFKASPDVEGEEYLTKLR